TLYSHSFLHSLLSTHPPPPRTSTLSLHDALPISQPKPSAIGDPSYGAGFPSTTISEDPPMSTNILMPALSPTMTEGTLVKWNVRSEEHTSELQSRENLVCRLLLEKKKKKS